VGNNCNLRTSSVNDAVKQLKIFEQNLIPFHGCTYHSCSNNPSDEFTNIFQSIHRTVSTVNVVIPYPDGIATSNTGGSMETGSSRIPKGLVCTRDNKYSGGYTRLIGGVPTDRSHHPWFTQLKVSTGPYAFACGGTIIDDEWVITSTKHCCQSDRNTIDAMIGGGNWIEGRVIKMAYPGY